MLKSFRLLLNPLLSTLVLAMFAACATIPSNLVEPKVDLQNVQVKEPSFTDATLVFQFLVDNPNDVPLKVDSVDYKIKLNGEPFTEGAMSEGLQVGSRSQSAINLPIRVKYSDLANSLSSFLQKGATPYEIQGSAKVGWFSIPFKKEGEVKLQQ